MKIELATAPSAAELSVLSRGIKDFNRRHLSEAVVIEEDTRFAVFAKNNNGEIVGGIRATAFWNYCIIELLWLAEESRGNGIGAKLMEQAEAHALAQGFKFMRTETLSFQARPFYEKMGYKVFGELEDYPPGHTTYCLVKSLALR